MVENNNLVKTADIKLARAKLMNYIANRYPNTISYINEKIMDEASKGNLMLYPSDFECFNSLNDHDKSYVLEFYRLSGYTTHRVNSGYEYIPYSYTIEWE